MQPHKQAFWRDESGAVTVDFVVLTAAICLIGAVVVLGFAGGTTDLGNDIEVFLNDVTIE